MLKHETKFLSFTLIFFELCQIYVDLYRIYVDLGQIYVDLCPETAKMIAQICEDRKKHKEVTINNGTHKGGPAAEGGRPTFVGGGRRPTLLWIGIPLLFLLFLHIGAIILAVSGHK